MTIFHTVRGQAITSALREDDKYIIMLYSTDRYSDSSSWKQCANAKQAFETNEECENYIKSNLDILHS